MMRTGQVRAGALVFYLVLIILSTVPGYYLIHFGVNFEDEPYQILNTMDLQRSPLSPMTTFLGGLLGRLTDFSWLGYRYLTVTLNNLSLLLAGYYLYKKSGSIKLSACIASILILLTGLSRRYHNLFGWDSFTVFFTIIIVYLLLTCIERPTAIKLLMLIAVSALTGLCRMPNFVCIPIVWTGLLLATFKTFNSGAKMPASYPWIYAAGSIVVTLGLLCLLYGSLGEYRYALDQNLISNHSIKYLLGCYFYSFLNVYRYSLQVIAIACIAFWCVRRIDNMQSNQKLLYAFVALTAAVCLLLIDYGGYFVIRFYDIAWLLIICAVAVLTLVSNQNRAGLLETVMMLCLGLVCIAGSNTGFTKYPGFALIPFAMAYISSRYSVRRLLIYSLIAATPLIIIDLKYMIKESFGDGGLFITTTRIDKGKAKGLYTTPQRAAVISEITDFKAGLSDDTEVIAVGEGLMRFCYEFMIEDVDTYNRHDWSYKKRLDSEEYIDWVDKRVNDSTSAQVYVLYFQRENESSKMKEYLDSKLDEYSHGSTYIIYARPDK